MRAAACYREFTPFPALREHVRAFFTYSIPAAPVGMGRSLTREIAFGGGQLPASPLFADGHASIVFSFGPAYRVEGLWPSGSPSGHAIGAMSQARLASHGDAVIQVGAYLRPARARPFVSVPACELADRIVALGDLWGKTTHVETRIREAHDDCERVSLLEQALVRRLGNTPHTRIDAAGLASHILQSSGGLSIEQLASAAGVSRQHLTRVFREEVGVTPKGYSRLARFRAALARMNTRPHAWADIAVDLGYADQSHLIADFKRFSGLTPAAMAAEHRFHPFTA
jgi:AraC-like DNA-binding protein